MTTQTVHLSQPKGLACGVSFCDADGEPRERTTLIKSVTCLRCRRVHATMMGIVDRRYQAARLEGTQEP